jgi:hypothetical protein
MQELWSHPRLFPSLVIDCSPKAQILAQVLVARGSHSVATSFDNPAVVDNFDYFDDLIETDRDPFESLLGGLSQERYMSLIEGLRIEVEEITTVVECYAQDFDLSQSLLILRTGWNAWRPRAEPNKDLRHPVFQGWHPFLVHPYMDMTTRDLVSKFAGIGTDCGGLDCPVYDLDETQHPEYASVRRRILSGKSKVQLPESTEIRFIQAQILSSFRVYLNNLSFAPEYVRRARPRIIPHAGRGLRGAAETILVCPIQLGSEFADAVPVSAFLL